MDVAMVLNTTVNNVNLLAHKITLFMYIYLCLCLIFFLGSAQQTEAFVHLRVTHKHVVK